MLERAFDFAFGLWPTHLAGPRFVTSVRGESQETCVVNRSVIFSACDDDFQIVVQARRGDTAEMLERVVW